MKDAMLIYNPTAGREQLKRRLPYILERLNSAGCEVICHETQGPGSATAAARRASEQGLDLVIAAGGDGTIYEIVNGLAELEYRPTLGIIPAGTTNDFARAVNIPRSIEKACDVLCNGHEMTIDIGKVKNSYFINIAGGGTLTELTYEVPSKLKARIGQLAYYAKGIEKLPFIKPTSIVIDYDGNVFDGEIMLFLVANTNSVGGFERLAPKAVLNDGKFDLLIVKKAHLVNFVQLVGEVLTGDHINNPYVIYAQASRIKVRVQGNMQINLDGENGGTMYREGEFVNLPNHFKLLV
jgi:diacylglycerol kinase (ATP)